MWHNVKWNIWNKSSNECIHVCIPKALLSKQLRFFSSLAGNFCMMATFLEAINYFKIIKNPGVWRTIFVLIPFKRLNFFIAIFLIFFCFKSGNPSKEGIKSSKYNLYCHALSSLLTLEDDHCRLRTGSLFSEIGFLSFL